jgi:hypothetical protein
MSKRKFKLQDYFVTATTAGYYLPGGDTLEISDITGQVTIEFRRGDDIIGEATISKNRDFSFDNTADDARAFTSVRIYTASGTQTLTATVGEAARSSGKTFSGDMEIVPATALSGSPEDAMADTETVTIAANTSRRDILIKNKHDSSGTLWVTDAAALGDGFPLRAGESMALNDYTGAVQVYSEGPNTLCVLQVT